MSLRLRTSITDIYSLMGGAHVQLLQNANNPVARAIVASITRIFGWGGMEEKTQGPPPLNECRSKLRMESRGVCPNYQHTSYPNLSACLFAMATDTYLLMYRYIKH